MQVCKRKKNKKNTIKYKYIIFFHCRYWHRSLNPKKLIEVGFSHLGRNMTLPRTLRLYRLLEQPKTPGFRKMTLADCPMGFKILKEVKLFKNRDLNFLILIFNSI